MINLTKKVEKLALVAQVLEQIEVDIDQDDHEAILELLTAIPLKKLREFMP